jgi:hypothetical protein
MDVILKEDKQGIAEVAYVLEKQYSLLENSLSAVKNLSNKLKADWQSDSATEYYQASEKLSNLGDKHKQELKSFSEKLIKIVGIYEYAEFRAKKEAESLPTDSV